MRPHVGKMFIMISGLASIFIFLFLSLQSRMDLHRSLVPQVPVYTLCTYFEPLGSPEDSEYREILEIWSESWSKYGWNTRVLTEKDAAQHPRYDIIRAELLKLPSINSQAYELSCYLRWVAAVASGCKVTT